MILFWSFVAIIFTILELLTLTFGFIFITIGALIITLLLSIDLLSETDFLYQILIMLAFAVISFIFFYRSFKKSRENRKTGFQEDMTAIVVNHNIKKGCEGKVKWCGTIFNALINEESNILELSVGENIVIEKFIGNTAIINKLNKE